MSKELGYEPAKGPDGKGSFSPKKGKENAGGNAPRQDGKNSDKSVNAGEHLWKQEHSEGADAGYC